MIASDARTARQAVAGRRKRAHRHARPTRHHTVLLPRTGGTRRSCTDRALTLCLCRWRPHTRSASARAETCIRVATQLHRCSPMRRGLRGEQGSEMRRRSHRELATPTRSSKHQPAGKGHSSSRSRDDRNDRDGAQTPGYCLLAKRRSRSMAGRPASGFRLHHFWTAGRIQPSHAPDENVGPSPFHNPGPAAVGVLLSALDPAASAGRCLYRSNPRAPGPTGCAR